MTPADVTDRKIAALAAHTLNLKNGEAWMEITWVLEDVGLKGMGAAKIRARVWKARCALQDDLDQIAAKTNELPQPDATP